MKDAALLVTAGLRLLEMSDAEELYALIDADREHLARWLPWAERQSVDDTLAFLRRSREQRERDDGFQAAVVPDGTIVGVVGFHAVDRGNRSTSIGYWLVGSAQGKGTMTAAVRTLTDLALVGWGLNRVEIRAAPENARSRAIPQRLGFREECLLREAELVGDRFLDSVVYGMLAADWRA